MYRTFTKNVLKKTSLQYNGCFGFYIILLTKKGFNKSQLFFLDNSKIKDN